MTILQIILLAAMCLLTLGTLLVELKRDLMMLQQNSYRPERYRKWLSDSGDSTSSFRLGGIIALMLCLTPFVRTTGLAVVVSCFCLWYLAKNLTVKYKKPLVWTPRARRIYAVAMICSAVVAVVAAFAASVSPLESVDLALLACYCLSHIIMVGAVYILDPYEKSVNRRYYRDAERRLAASPDLKIVGITGSYGKTSTKYYLHRILSEQFETLMTPGSFNTTLGVVRTVREHLKPFHEVFIVEMGAKQPGDIREICDLVHPGMGIVTAVGPQHLESFKTIERVCSTKFELVDALPADGLAIVNNDFAPIAARKVDNCKCLRYAATDVPGADVRATDIVYSNHGTDFTVLAPGREPLRLHTRLVGEFNISNLTAAVAAAWALGVPDSKIRVAVDHIEPVEHRLSMTRTPGGITILDDAFNSNPVGSRMALDVLKAMNQGQRIVVTPGMIELGEKQEELNREFGRTIARSVDVAIIVGQYNRRAILDGIADVDNKDVRVIEADTFDQARRKLSEILRPGDTVLYENDLPDTFK